MLTTIIKLPLTQLIPKRHENEGCDLLSGALEKPLPYLWEIMSLDNDHAICCKIGTEM